MTNKEILHKIILGMDGYLSCGVPSIYWDLAVNLTKEIYGEAGLSLLNKSKKIYNDQIDYETTLKLHTISSWENGGNFEITPEILIERLEKL